ncbi:TrmH family RNA methyltransferase [Hymenobacter qilianensis]|uniref:TrmH family RNA methyltransferase n=1 Tax=Hymenobacter qilianensis TaxID=1385715 RepID=UPI0021D126EB|nr:TrmH family RNA methyltransferase [Hymenobacter qilianensis]
MRPAHRPLQSQCHSGQHWLRVYQSGGGRPTAEVVAWLRQHGIRSYATTPAATGLYTNMNFSGPSAIVMGTEATGLSDEWLAAADAQIKIPMAGYIDSLNVSTCTAIMTFEAVRQRGGQI